MLLTRRLPGKEPDAERNVDSPAACIENSFARWRIKVVRSNASLLL